jgi:hypothetical protein
VVHQIKWIFHHRRGEIFGILRRRNGDHRDAFSGGGGCAVNVMTAQWPSRARQSDVATFTTWMKERIGLPPDQIGSIAKMAMAMEGELRFPFAPTKRGV